MHSHPGVRLLLEIQFLRLGGTAGRAVQSHVTADRGPRLPCLVGWKGMQGVSGKTRERPQVPGKPSFRRQRVRRDCACEPPCSPVYCVVPRPEATTALESALTLALNWLHPPAGTCEVDTGRGAEEPAETCTRWTRVSSPLDCLVGTLKVADISHHPPQASLRL